MLINRPNSINLNIALSNKNDSAIIRVYDIDYWGIYNTNASLNHLPAHQKLLSDMSKNKYMEQATKTFTYKKLIDELNITNLDLFILDVEGHEMEVIEGMIGCDVLPDIFVIEHGHRNIDFFQEYLDKLNSKYVLDYVFGVNSFYKKLK